MPLVLFFLVAIGGAKIYSNHQALSQRVAALRALEVDPRFVPVRIESPEFYAALAARYNRPFLGK